ncbi:hydrogenase maturation nickel metallochaperone HypA [Afifella sp. IM 167]|uniref:hydrogenase maturation nickel metallochaperone HypA n=1 Tax=Afifella sp. IM 167 TaxID=2033586 RepID=UPI001CCAE992|nr:hydrogenase maturation nickel metallochaperone HypA [Afifella sp. IM 167]MBZ8133252.1 hypothetical protein [Afifella sp. IM 167]
MSKAGTHTGGGAAERAEAKERQPFRGVCTACGHVWTVAYLPMPIPVFVRTAKSARCPNCGGDKINVADEAIAQTVSENGETS